LLGTRGFALFWFGQTASQLGDWLLRIALPLYVFARTGSVLSTGLTFLASTLPAIVLAPIAGTLVDRWRVRRTMIGADLGRAVILVALLFEPGRDSVWIIYLCAAAQACLSQFFAPARNALLPTLVAHGDLLRANAAVSFGSELALLGGPALGGLVYATEGLRPAVGLDMASYLVSAITIAALPGERVRDAKVDGLSARDPARLSRQFGDGLSLARHNPTLRSLFTVTFVLFVGGGLLPVVIVPFVRLTLHGTGTEYGLVLSAQALGGMFGAAIASRAIRSIATPRAPIAASLLAMAAAVGLLATATRWWVAALCLAAGGIPTTISAVATNMILQTVPAEGHRARITGLYSAVVALGIAIGAPAAGPLVGALGPAGGVAVAAGVFAGAGLLALILLPGPPWRLVCRRLKSAGTAFRDTAGGRKGCA
jgi:predicted MFS family arabinose efflux permease